ncbi:helix-turn-helix domain-containing protein [Glacieibacterium megasporae]|uniref:helix-turn-helix domain-containing protein n=1 Tax=Glacieibacterium megasporae TaxID=2835787 RepID=UPI001C1E3179|nr:helix-turn-helix transcriptional regulator [Polymorphobacter megasporae]UAJ10505.1 helix-turn-helix domain-containing protein [Polymorphobacter megasporae]
MNARSILGWNIRKLRLERGLSQERLAADTGIDRAYVSELERGTVAASVDMIGRLAAAFKVEPSQMLDAPTDTSNPPPNLRKGRKPG